MIRLMAVSIALSIVYQLTNNLSVCILYHIGSNAAVTAALGFGRSEGTVPILIMFIAVSIISLIFLVESVRKKAIEEGTLSFSSMPANVSIGTLTD